MNKSKPKVILLTAGEGKRLRPYTLDRPKCMVQIDGLSLIDRQLAVLYAEGLNNIVMIGGYRSEMLKRDNIKIINNPRFFETNMVWSLFCAQEELEGDIIVSYGDIVYSRKILQSLLKSNADIAITIDKNWESYWKLRNEDPLDDAETLKLDKDGSVSEIGKKPKILDEIEGQYMGLIKLSPRGVRQMKKLFHDSVIRGNLLGKDVENAFMTDLLQGLIDEGLPIKAVEVFDCWVEVDTVDDLMLDETLKRVNKISETL